MEVVRCSLQGRECILIGHHGHPEVEGTMGRYDTSSGGKIYLVEDVEDVAALEVDDPENLFYASQTTLSMDDCAEVIASLRKRFPAIEGPKTDDICYATQNRQDAVKKLANECDLMLIVGSENSSNSNRLRELAQRMGTEAYLIDGAADVDPAWLEGKATIGISAGASAPEILVQQVCDRLETLGARQTVEVQGQDESVHFSLPVELRS
jgi:4-hydroxy-3-methylbut-2-enyl diphosphate reductase